jgi:hypothetical protein
MEMARVELQLGGEHGDGWCRTAVGRRSGEVNMEMAGVELQLGGEVGR